MKITFDLPTKLLCKAQRISHSRTKTETIIRGLEALVHQSKLDSLLQLKGKISLDINLDKSRGRIKGQ